MAKSFAMRRVGDFFNTLFNWLLVAVLIINLYNVAMRNIFDEPLPMINGRGYAVVVSGSMEPAINISDIVYIKEQSTYEVGDVITFVDADSPSEALVTHRIVEVTEEGYVTKGDANNTKDNGVVDPLNIKGAVYMVVPYFGATLLWMQKPVGTLSMVLLCLLLIELPYRARAKYGKASKERIEEVRAKIGPKAEKKKFTPDLYWEENDGKYKAPSKTKKQLDFEKEIDYRRRKKQKRKVYVPDEKHWDIE